jgi:hypothetical protein
MNAKRIVIVTCVIAIVLASFARSPQSVALAADNPIVVENQQQGSAGWQIGNLIADDANGQIKGYASATSVNQGQSLSLYVSVNPAQNFSIDIYRMGWYSGAGGRLRSHVGPLSGTKQSACVPAAGTGLIACGWTASQTFSVPSDWTSGIYLALLTNAAGYQNYIIFVVRDGRPASFLYQQPINTYEAYNNYPNDGAVAHDPNGTGKSLYGFNSYGANTVSGEQRAVKVSFDRPYTGDGAGYFVTFEINLVRWLEKNGYDVTYSTDIDTHANGAALRNSKAFFSTGHDEYWSKGMYDAAVAARDAGVGLAFFGANAVYWQVRYEASASGAPNRVMVCYKDRSIDPVQGATTTVQWRDPALNRAEQSLIGEMFIDEVNWGQNAPYVVTNSSHWAYAGTGFHDGDAVPGIVGYEMDRVQTGFPAPPNGASQVLLSHSPFNNWNGQPEYATSSIYQAPSGALVFATGTMSWSWGLDNYWFQYADPRIQRTTANILNAFLNGAPRVVNDLKVTAPATATPGQGFSVTVVAEDAMGSPVPGYTGTVHFASSDTAPGVVLPPDSTLANGQGTFQVTLATLGPQTLTVSDAAHSLSTTASVTVQGPSANHLVLATTATPIAGASFSFTVAAQDQSGNTDTSYAGTVHFASSDTSAGVVLPANATLTNGVGTFSANLIRAGSQTITATDTATASITGTLSVSVRAAPATGFALTRSTGTPTAGTAFTVTAKAQDQFGNIDTSYAGTVHWTSSDTSTGVVLPANGTLTNGQGTFQVTLTKAGAQTITATDTVTASITGQTNVTVRAAAAASLTLDAPSSVTMNQAFNVTVTAKDGFGNLTTGYTGAVHFSTSDISPLVRLPADYPFTAADAGVHTFSVTLQTPPSQSLTVTDKNNAALTDIKQITVKLPLLP